MAQGTFGTAIACIDGRVQAPIAEWLRSELGVDYIDMVTVPGPDAALLHLSPDLLASIRQSVEVSVRAHHSPAVAVAGHYDCAAYPVSDQEHITATRAAAQAVAAWNLGVRVIGLWVNEHWQVEVVWDSAQKSV
jgi:hypothetical protein